MAGRRFADSRVEWRNGKLVIVVGVFLLRCFKNEKGLPIHFSFGKAGTWFIRIHHQQFD